MTEQDLHNAQEAGRNLLPPTQNLATEALKVVGLNQRGKNLLPQQGREI